MEAIEEMKGEGVVEDVYEVREEAMLLQTEVVQMEASGLTPQTDGQAGKQQSAQKDDEEDERLERQRQQAQIGEQKQRYESHQWKILGTKDAG